MDEKNKKVNTQDTANKSSQNEKLTYEQLEQIAGNLNQRCNMLYQQLQQAQNAIAEFNEIDMLLNILKQAEQFSSKFVERCANKVEELITKALDASEEQAESQNTEKN